MTEPSQITIKRATALAEAALMDGIYSLEAECFGESAWSQKEFEASVSDSSHVTLFAALFKGGDGTDVPVGFLMLGHAADEGEIMNIAVRGDFRRRGIGRRLMAAAEAYAQLLGVRVIFLEVRAANEGARALYERVGYFKAAVRRGYYKSPKDDAVIMKKHIGET